MTRYYDADGDPISADELAREVLAPDEYAEYRKQRRETRERSSTPPHTTTGLRVDEYGYERDGTYHIDLDGRDPWERWSA